MMSANEMSAEDTAARMADSGAVGAGAKGPLLPMKLNLTDAPTELLVEVVGGREMLLRIERRSFAPIMSVMHRALEAAGRHRGRFLQVAHIRRAIASLKPLYIAESEQWRWITSPTVALSGAAQQASKDDDLARYLWWLIFHELYRDESVVVGRTPRCVIELQRVWQARADELRESSLSFPPKAGSQRKVVPR